MAKQGKKFSHKLLFCAPCVWVCVLGMGHNMSTKKNHLFV